MTTDHNIMVAYINVSLLSKQCSGHKLEFLLEDDRIMLPINKSVRSLKGLLPKPSISLTCEEMNDVIRKKA